MFAISKLVRSKNILTTFSVISCIQTIVVYLYVLFLTRFASETEYAHYISITYIVDFTVAISLFGFNLLILREGEDYIKQNICSILSLSAIIGIIIWSICVMMSTNIILRDYAWSLILICVQYLYQLGTCFQIRYKQNGIAFVNAVVNFLFTIVSLLLLLHFNKLDAENVILVRIVQLVVFAIICYASVIRHIKPADAPTFRKIWNNLKMAVPIGGASILGVAIQYIDKLILSTQSVTDIAQYSVARFEIPFIGIFVANLSLTLIPSIKENMQKNNLQLVHDSIRRLFRYGWYFNVIIFTLLFCNAELVLTVLYSEAYIVSAGLFRIIILVYLFKVVTYTNIIIALGIERIIIPRLLTEMVLQVASSLLFLHLWGVTGLAVSLVCILVLWNVPYNIYYFMKKTNGTLKDILPLKDMFIFFVKCFVPNFIIACCMCSEIKSVWKLLITMLLIFVLCFKEIKYIYSNTR